MAVWSYSPQEVLGETLVSQGLVTAVAPASAVTGLPTDNLYRAFKLRYSLTDTAQVASMVAFFTAQRGPFSAFDYWHVADRRTYRARFDGAMTTEVFAPGLARAGEVVIITVVGS